MSFRVLGESVSVDCRSLEGLLLDRARVLSLAPQDLVIPLDKEYSRIEVTMRRMFFTFRDVFDVRVERRGRGLVVYSLEAPRYRLEFRFYLIEEGEECKIEVEVEGIGVNIGRFRGRLEPAIEEFLDRLHEEALKLRAARAEEAPRGASAGPEALPPQPQDPLAEGSRRLADPLFEAEILVRGTVAFVDRVLLTRVADIVDRLAAMERYDPSKTYVAKVSVAGVEATILLERGRIAGALIRVGERKLVGLSALQALQEKLPGEASVTVIEVP